MKNVEVAGRVHVALAAVFMLGVTAARAADISYTTNITSGVFNGGSAFTVGNTTNGITVTVSGGAITNGSGTIGSGSAANVSNTVIVTGSGVWSSSNVLYIGNVGAFSGLVVSNGGTVYASGGDSAILGNSFSGSNNWALVTGAGSVWTNISGTFWVGKNSNGNTLTVNNNGAFYAPNRMDIIQTNNTLKVMDGGKFFVAGIFNIGHTGSSNATVLVSGAGAVAQASAGVNLGAEGVNPVNSRLIVTNGGVFMNNNSLYVGGRKSNGALAVVTGSGSKIDGTGILSLGFALAHPGTNGTLLILDGGLVKANGAAGLAFYGLNNMVTNNGGILQFTTAAPTLTGLGTAGAVVMDSGTLSYSGAANVNITNNWTSTGVGLFVWQGKNTLRLDGSTATNALATVYHFQTNQTQGAKNYVNLEMLGTSTLRGKGVMIGDSGRLLISNALATIDGPFTNNGTMTVANSTLVLSGNAAFNGTLNINLSYLNGTDCAITNSNLSLGADSVIAFTGTTASDVLPVIRHTGGRTGTFKTVSGVPTGYSLRYREGFVELLKRRGTLIRVQ